MPQAPRYDSDPSAVQTALNVVGELDLRVTSIEEILELLTPVFRGFIVEAPRFKPGVDLFRAHVCETSTHKRTIVHASAPNTFRKSKPTRKSSSLLLYIEKYTVLRSSP